MVSVIQYFLGFVLQLVALYSATVFGVDSDLPMLFIAMFFQLCAFLLLKDLLFAPIVKQVEKLFFHQGFDTGSDFSRIDTLVYKEDFQEALKLIDEYIAKKPDCAKAYLKKCQIQYDHLKDLDGTIATGYERLNSKELTEEDERLIFLVLDILVDCQKVSDARQVIESVLGKIKHEQLKGRLQSRLINLG